MPKRLLYSYVKGSSSPNGWDFLEAYWGNSEITKVTNANDPNLFISLSGGSYVDMNTSNYIAGFYHKSNKLYQGGTISGKCRHMITTGGTPTLAILFRGNSSTVSYSINGLSHSIPNLTGCFHFLAYNSSLTKYVIEVYRLSDGEQVYYEEKSNDNTEAVGSRRSYIEFSISGYQTIAPPMFLPGGFDHQWFPFLPSYYSLDDFRTCYVTSNNTITSVTNGQALESIGTVSFTDPRTGYPESYIANNNIKLLNSIEPPKRLSPPSTSVPVTDLVFKTNYKLNDTYPLYNASEALPSYNWGVGLEIPSYKSHGSTMIPVIKKGCRPIVKQGNQFELSGGTLYKDTNTGAIINNSTEVLPAGLDARWIILSLQAGGGGGMTSISGASREKYCYGGYSGNYRLVVVPLVDTDGSYLTYNIGIGTGGSAQQSSGNHDGGNTYVISTNGKYKVIVKGGPGGSNASRGSAYSDELLFNSTSYPSNLQLFTKAGVRGDGSSISGGTSEYNSVYGSMYYSTHYNEYHWSGTGLNQTFHVYGGGPSLWDNSPKYEVSASAPGVGGGSGDWNYYAGRYFFNNIFDWGWEWIWEAENNAGNGASGFAKLMY